MEGSPGDIISSVLYAIPAVNHLQQRHSMSLMTRHTASGIITNLMVPYVKRAIEALRGNISKPNESRNITLPASHVLIAEGFFETIISK